MHYQPSADTAALPAPDSRSDRFRCGREIKFLAAMRAAVVGMMLLCEIAQGAEPKSVTNSIGMELIEIPAGKFVMGKESRAVNAGLLEGKTLT